MKKQTEEVAILGANIHPLLKKLARVLRKEKAEIIRKWMNKTKSFGGSYAQVSFTEQSGLFSEFLDAFADALSKGNFLNLRTFIEKISHIRSLRGFRLSEIQRVYYSIYDIIRPFIVRVKLKEKIPNEIIKNVYSNVNSVLMDILFELSEAYHMRQNEKLDDYIDAIESVNLRLKETSIKDGLTECYNHKFFHDTLDSEIRRSARYGRPLSIIMFDIDRFKDVNDKYGHIFGDKILKEISNILRKSIRGYDTVARYGGEEFTIILPETRRRKALKCAERIRKKISRVSFNLKGKKIKLTVSGGVDGFDKKEIDKTTFISNVDKALYMAKRRGRNRVIIYSR